MPSFVQILDFIGTFAFAISGIRLASAKRFDWFGAYIVGLATAIGGGTLRDVMLNVTPVWMTDPIYLICTAFAMFVVIISETSYPPEQYFLLVRQHRTGIVYSRGLWKKYFFGISLLGSNYHG